jgi:hypothetical protein
MNLLKPKKTLQPLYWKGKIASIELEVSEMISTLEAMQEKLQHFQEVLTIAANTENVSYSTSIEEDVRC